MYRSFHSGFNLAVYNYLYIFLITCGIQIYVRFFPFSRPEFILFSVNILFKIYPHIFFTAFLFLISIMRSSIFFTVMRNFVIEVARLFFPFLHILTLQMADRQAVPSFIDILPPQKAPHNSFRFVIHV